MGARIMTEKIEVSLRNLTLDITQTIQDTFYAFIRNNPDWYEDVDWNNHSTSYRFGLQSQQSVNKIMELPAMKYLLERYNGKEESSEKGKT